jgi:hypothetical protein
MPIDTSEPDVREWLKDSYLGRVVMFLSRLPDESADNRTVARDLVDKWVSQWQFSCPCRLLKDCVLFRSTYRRVRVDFLGRLWWLKKQVR